MPKISLDRNNGGNPLLIKLAQAIDSIINKKEVASNSFALLLGAGASVPSGIPSANKMIEHFKQKIYNQESKNFASKEEENAWLKNQDWFLPDNSDYANFFEKCYETKRERQSYLESLIVGKKPSFGYFVLANLIHYGYFKTILTTNFDDLVYTACTTFTETRPVVYALGGFATEMQLTSVRPRILKIHGDFLYSDLKNVSKEFNQQDVNMEGEFKAVLDEYDGLIVSGYSGNDKSVLKILAEMPEEKLLYWCHRKDSPPNQSVRDLVKGKGRYFVEVEGFDELMDFVRQHIKITNKQLAQNYRFNLDNVRILLSKFEDNSTIEFIEEIAKSYDILSLYVHANESFRNGNYSKAKKLYEKIIKKDDRDFKAFYNLGIIYSLDRATLQRAEECYKKAIYLNANFDDVYNNLGILIAKDEKRLNETQFLYEKALSLNDKNPSTYNNLAVFYTRKQQFKSALSKIQKAIELTLDDSRSLSNYFLTLATIYKKLNKEKEFRKILLKAKETTKANSLYQNACIAALEGNVEASIEYLQKAMTANDVVKLDSRCDVEFDWIRDDPRFRSFVSD
jgi:Flp pilus assembly protein TadD/NAD-dependent SIR2 family protein deacetylase